MRTVATRYEWAPNKTYITFSTVFTSTTASFVNYSGNLFAQSAGASQPAFGMWYTNAKSEITQAVISPGRGDDWSERFDSDGQSYRVDIWRESDDGYRWNVVVKNVTGWKPVMSLEFRRSRQ